MVATAFYGFLLGIGRGVLEVGRHFRAQLVSADSDVHGEPQFITDFSLDFVSEGNGVWVCQTDTGEVIKPLVDYVLYQVFKCTAQDHGPRPTPTASHGSISVRDEVLLFHPHIEQ